jgi:hypothetical protein
MERAGCQVDETFVGGKNKNRHRDKRTDGPGGEGKVPVMGAIQRGGTVVARVVKHVDLLTATRFVNEAVSTKVDLVATAESRIYNRETERRVHESVIHSRGEYVRGEVHICTIDSFWSLLKRGIIGTFHNVRAKYLPLYVAEFEWRYNLRDHADIFGEAVARC